MRVPTRSDGTRSGVNWSRTNEPPTTVASVSAARVLARPGAPSRRQWPRAIRATNNRSMTRSCPTITRLTSNMARSMVSAGRRPLPGPQPVGEGLGGVDGNGEADVLGAVGGHGGVDADHLPGRVDERAAGVAGVDGGVGLDHPGEVLDRAAEGGDDAPGDGGV